MAAGEAAPAASSTSFPEWLHFDRLRRELKYRLDGAFDCLAGNFSFVRSPGLRELATVVHQAALSETDMRLLYLLQNDFNNYNIAERILPLILARKKFQPCGAITDQEKRVAMQLLHDLCVMHPPSRKCINGEYMEALVDYLNHTGLEQAALAALEAALVDHSENQDLFERAGGLRAVAGLLTNKRNPMDVRLRCAEFLYFLLMPDQDLEAKGGESERLRNLRCHLGVESTDLLLEMVSLNEMDKSLREYVREIDENAELS